jgi:diaminohydroxyphosphoribosylaminopyrimidine deaminase/5-amino-6-(5-phosphoribosylamino)uracil reductase
MYVTLEPCSHHGRTPPCADAILRAGIARVVCAIEDPDPRVSGKGVALLRKAGVTVDVGVCAEEARWMAAGHILRMTRRPFVQLKLAVSQDGLIARGDGAPRWVTGPEARALGHLMRARTDAILVGRGTVSDDDPELTCRLPGLAGASPRRIVLDARFRTSPSAKLVGTAAEVPVTIIGGTEATPPRYPTGVTIKRAAQRDLAARPHRRSRRPARRWHHASAGRRRTDRGALVSRRRAHR